MSVDFKEPVLPSGFLSSLSANTPNKGASVVKEVLSEAIAATSTDRPNTHGKATDNFKHTAGMWSAYLGVKITAYDVCQMQTMSKMSRSKKGKKKFKDHFVDQCGYSALAYEMALEEEEE